MTPEQVLYDKMRYIQTVVERLDDLFFYQRAWRWVQFGLLVAILVKVW